METIMTRPTAKAIFACALSTGISGGQASSLCSGAWIVEKTTTSAEASVSPTLSFTAELLDVTQKDRRQQLGASLVFFSSIHGEWDGEVQSDFDESLFVELSDPIHQTPDRAAIAEKAKRDVLRELYEVDRAYSSVETLRSLRLKSGMSQKDLAIQIGKDQAYVSRLESGAFANPERKTMRRICTALGCDMNTLDACLGEEVA